MIEVTELSRSLLEQLRNDWGPRLTVCVLEGNTPRGRCNER